MALRFYDKQKITISEDASVEPKLIRCQEESEVTDVTTLSEVVTRQETFPVGTHVISLGNISQGKFLMIKPKASTTAGTVVMNLDGSLTAHSLRAGKITKMWTNYTSLSLTVAVASVELLIVMAGD